MPTTGTEQTSAAPYLHRLTPAVMRVMEWHRLHQGVSAAEPPPLVSPMPHSDILDREEPEFSDEPDLPGETPSPREHDASAKDAHAAAGPESVAGEEDPGAALDDA